MTLKCWTAAVRQPPMGSAGGVPPEMRVLAATAASASASTTAAPSASSSGAAGAPPATAPAALTILTGATAGARPADGRRRSVGFITTSTGPATSPPAPAAVTPTRHFVKHKQAAAAANRLRSLSSTWESLDSECDEDDEELEDDDHEEKLADRLAQQSRRDLVFTPAVPGSGASGGNNENLASNNRSSPGPHRSHHHHHHHHHQHPAPARGNQQPQSTADAPHTPSRRRSHGSRHSRSRRRRTVSESSGSSGSRRVKILTPVASPVANGGWIRGQPAEVRWEVVDKSVQLVRIDVCNVAWSVPTTIASRVPNNGHFDWRRVYWGMPITDGYYINIYDVTHAQQQAPAPSSVQQQPHNGTTRDHRPRGAAATTGLVLLARSELFAVVG